MEIDTRTGELIKDSQLSNDNPGMIDLATEGDFVYALSPGNGTVGASVAVFDVSGGRGTARAVQNSAVPGVPDSAQGMAIF